jgi:hypothetical protein
MWTDYRLSGNAYLSMIQAAAIIKDHKLIRMTEEDSWTPDNANAEFRKARDFFVEKFDERFDGQTLIVTHHLPHGRLIGPGYEDNPLNGAYASNCEVLLDMAGDIKAVGWICGHDHQCRAKLLGEVMVYSAQTGYGPRQDSATGWAGMRVIEVSNV